MITIGVDPHKCSHTAVALDEGREVLDELRVPANKATLTRLQRWARHWPERTWAIEGANGLGHLLAQQLVAEGDAVVDVPATLAARTRQLDRGHGRKTDGIDAQAVATVAQCHHDLRRVVSSVSSLTVGTSWPESAGGDRTGQPRAVIATGSEIRSGRSSPNHGARLALQTFPRGMSRIGRRLRPTDESAHRGPRRRKTA